MVLTGSYHRLHLPVNTHVQNMFSNDVKHLSFTEVSNFEVFLPKCEVLMSTFAQLLEKNNSAQVLSRDIRKSLESGMPF